MDAQRYGPAAPSTFLFLHKDIEPLFALTHVPDLTVLCSAGAPDDRRRTIVLYGWLFRSF